MPTLSTSIAPSNGGIEREGIIDAVLRIYDGLDSNDQEMFISGFTTDCVIDITGVIMDGQPMTVLHGLHEEIVPKTFQFLGPLGSTHSLSNFRVAMVNPSEAMMTFYISAQHFAMKPEGSDPLISDEFYLMNNKYKATVVKAENGIWLVKKIVGVSRWAQGDTRAMAGLDLSGKE